MHFHFFSLSNIYNQIMGILQLNSHGLAAAFSVSHNFNRISSIATDRIVKVSNSRCFSRGRIRAVGTIPENQTETATTSEEPPSVKFAFVSVSPQKKKSLLFTILEIYFWEIKPRKIVCLSLFCFLMEHQTCTFVLLVEGRNLGI